jgi:hypothetical protein
VVVNEKRRWPVEVAHENWLETIDVQALFPALKLNLAICCAGVKEQVAHFVYVLVVGIAHYPPQGWKIAFSGNHVRICAHSASGVS